jgi:hypothetical protein
MKMQAHIILENVAGFLLAMLFLIDITCLTLGQIGISFEDATSYIYHSITHTPTQHMCLKGDTYDCE